MIDRAASIQHEFDVIASVATGGIAHGVALARALMVPHVIVKKEEKTTHGLKGLIDGDAGLLPGARVLMVEDMSSTFESTLRAMRPIGAEDGRVKHTFAISTWGFPEFYENAGEHQVHVLCTGEQIVDCAKRFREIGPAFGHMLSNWLKNPRDESWVDELTWKRPAA
jgi:orotate phosphoribosyltransferase